MTPLFNIGEFMRRNMTAQTPLGEPNSWNPMSESAPMTIGHHSPIPTDDSNPRSGVPKILILVGLPASGKSSYARQWVRADPTNRLIINYTELRNGHPLTPETDKLAKQKAMELAEAAIKLGKSVVIDHTNLTLGARMRWLDLARKLNCDSEVLELDVAVRTCVWRDSTRTAEQSVGRAVIHRMALLTGWIDWTTTSTHRKFMILDLDGVIADNRHRRLFIETNPADYKAYLEAAIDDKPIPQMIDMVKRLALHYSVLIVTARPIDICGKITEQWIKKHLNNNGLEDNYLYLFMRNAGDKRDSVEVKKEILGYLPPKDRIAMVLEDQEAIADMYRQEGLTVLKVGAI
jgi:predicted kinase